MPTIHKVAVFITRHNDTELLVFEHPYAGIQIPAGTVEEGETPTQAAVREAAEETGLRDFTTRAYLGLHTTYLPDDQRMIARATKAYARPDTTSFDWVELRRGIQVSAHRRTQGFTQITYQEMDDTLHPQYVTFHITAWAPDNALADTIQRHFFHLAFRGESPARWNVQTDHHTFVLFWAPRDALPPLIAPQDTLLTFLNQS